MPQGDVTVLLQRWNTGDNAARSQLAEIVYAELNRLAHRHLRRERAGHSLCSTELVNEAYLRLVNQKEARWQDRAHFFAVSAQIMRRILIDHARAHLREKRGAGAPVLQLNENLDFAQAGSVELVRLDDALNGLAELDAQQSRVVELRFFTGLSIEETAEVLGVSKATVNRDWVTARAWLNRELSR